MTVKDARVALGWTQQKLAAEADVVQQQISRLERGEVSRVSLTDVRKIVRAFHRAGLKGLTADTLFPDSIGQAEQAS